MPVPEWGSLAQVKQDLSPDPSSRPYQSLTVVPCIIFVLPDNKSHQPPLRKRGETLADLRSLSENQADSQPGKHLRLSYITPSEDVVEEYKRKSLPLLPSRPTSNNGGVGAWAANAAEVCDIPTSVPRQSTPSGSMQASSEAYCVNATPALDPVSISKLTKKTFEAYCANPTPALDGLGYEVVNKPEGCAGSGRHR